MDEMKIESKWTREKASQIIGWLLRKKFGYDVDVVLNNFRTTMVDDKMQIHLDVDLELSKSELNKILTSSIGL